MTFANKTSFARFAYIVMLLWPTSEVFGQEVKAASGANPALFKAVEPAYSGVTFRNDIVEDSDLNAVKYTYAYNGGGVAIGDINNDGLPDIVLVSNQKGPRLYLNLGHLKFKDITDEAGLGGFKGWFTGVNIVDVDGDGWNDIYLCRSGPVQQITDRTNLLFINQHNLTFKEKGAEFNLDDSSGTTQAVFFDFDNDGELDVYLANVSRYLNEPAFDISRFNDSAKFSSGAPKLLLNKNNHFVDFSKEAGLRKQIHYSLNAIACDINYDGYPDLLISDDFISPDILYINNAGKKLEDKTSDYLKKTSFFSMGSDAGDLNRDGLQDMMVVDMLPEDHFRMKNNFLPFNYEFYNLLHKNIRPRQYIKNSVYLGALTPPFSEVAHLTGMARTDWSWTTLIQDFDNDGWNDVYVTSGTKRDQFDLDFMNINASPEERKEFALDLNTLYLKMPLHKFKNHLFKNNGNLQFDDSATAWGLGGATRSNGAAYADLDNDGDIDIVVNNTDDVATIFENMANEQLKNSFVRFKLVGNNKNTAGIGATIKIDYDTISQVKYLTSTRGFESCSEPVAHFGLGNFKERISQVEIFWPGGDHQILRQLKADSVYTVYQKNATDKKIYRPETKALHLLEPIQITSTPVVHNEDYYVDFKRDRLTPFKMSAEGPALAVGDVNKDGLEDFFIGGAKGSTGQLWLQNSHGTFNLSTNQPWMLDSTLENQGCVIADLNGDGWPDLLVASGSNENRKGDKGNVIKLYLNNGKGGFTDASSRIPQLDICYSAISVCDFNKDGKPDIFAAGRLMPEDYPSIPPSRLLVNDGKGNFTDATKELAPDLIHAGNIRSAIWTDYDNDGWPDLVVAGDWMPVKFFHNDKGKLSEAKNTGIDSSFGLWTNVVAADFDHDGNTDFIVCNYGKNGYLKATRDEPVSLYYEDFDDNGVKEQLVFHYLHDTLGMLYDRNTYCEQMPKYWKKYFTFHSFAKAGFSDFIPDAKLKEAQKFEWNEQRSCYIKNLGNGKFKMVPLPIEAQFSDMTAALAVDINGDGNLDIVMVGNADINQYQYGPMDGTNGLVLLGDGKGNFKPLTKEESGFNNPGYGRSLKLIRGSQGSTILLVGNNNEPLRAFRLKAKNKW